MEWSDAWRSLSKSNYGFRDMEVERSKKPRTKKDVMMQRVFREAFYTISKTKSRPYMKKDAPKDMFFEKIPMKSFERRIYQLLLELLGFDLKEEKSLEREIFRLERQMSRGRGGPDFFGL